MKNIIVLNKKEGETPLEALEVFRHKNKKYKDLKMTYAGRLDPLVSGLLLVLVGDAVREKEKYLSLSKEYAFDILFGFATDTHDILGKIVHSKVLTNIGTPKFKKEIKNNLKYFRGKFIQKYPLYSSKNIKQVRKGEKVEVSEHIVEVKRLKFLGYKKVSGSKLFGDIEKRIKKVGGDFRQKEILNIWYKTLKDKRSVKFLIGSFYVQCGSGMYVRRLAHDLGESVGIPALAWKIKRTKVGKFGKISQWKHRLF